MRRTQVVGTGALAVVFVLGLLWAKWLPYTEKTRSLSHTHTWAGASMFPTADDGTASSLTEAWQFTTAYFASVWHAAVVALLVAAAIDALLPRAWLATVMNRRSTFGQSFAGGAAALPSLMCTCCTAPVTVGLRERGASVASSLAYWVGNPVLNPAVLVFLFLVAPWQFGTVRLVVGAVLVFGASAFVARFAKPPAEATTVATALPGDTEPEPFRTRDLPLRYVRSLGRFTLILVPEYIAAVMVIGWLNTWLADFAGFGTRLGLLAVAVCALAGTLLVIPTGGEIPVVLALTAAGVGVGSAGALLITLPALSLPSMIMVGRALSWRVTAAMATAVAAAGLAGATLLWALW